jgi:site-specific DNA recombinase
MSTKPRAVMYVRLSRESAVSTSIEGQNADLYTLAEREGWEIVRTFEDNGKSGGKQRENARAALDMLTNNEADVLAVYAYDRWSRMGIADSAEVIKAVYAREAAAKRGKSLAPLFYAAREGIRSDQEGWEIRVAFAADVAQKERDRMVSRRKASIERMRNQGRNPGNGPAPFGYRSAPFADGRPGRRFVVDHDEATLIRDVADRLVDGASCTAIAHELNARHVPMPRSPHRLAQLKGEPTVDPETGEPLATGVWSSSRVSQIWASEHLLGRIMHKTEHVATDDRTETDAGTRHRARFGEPILDPATGLPLQAFDPVLSLETALAIRERFAGNRGKGQQLKRRAARLLSGLVFCGVCDSAMYVISSSGYSYYRCSGPSRGIACPGLRITTAILEDGVTEKYLASFGRLRAVSVIERKGAPEVDEAIALLTQQINATAAKLADEDADVPALLAQRSSLIARRAALREVAPTNTVERIDLGKTWGDAFEAAETIEAKRSYIAAAYDHVVVKPQAEGADRIQVVTKPSLDEAPDYYRADETTNIRRESTRLAVDAAGDSL